MKSRIWLSYELGLRGDYEGLYAWLDQNDAKECCDNLAFLEYEHDGELLHSLKKEMENAFEISKKSRFYVIFRDHETDELKGKFIFGSRKAPRWKGFAYDGQDEEDVM